MNMIKNKYDLFAGLSTFIVLTGLVVASAFIFQTKETQELSQHSIISDDGPTATITTQYGKVLPVAYDNVSVGCLCGPSDPVITPYFINIAIYLVVISAVSLAVYTLVHRRLVNRPKA
ncbi:MAG: hypothetical protein JWM52_829 [Candidatus Saccharibacteria bacterium]|nr:hypothetical protein [Candidatus Saccharibacteria bacterium]